MNKGHEARNLSSSNAMTEATQLGSLNVEFEHKNLLAGGLT